MQPSAPTIFLATDDARLQSKAVKLFATSKLSVVIATAPTLLLSQIREHLRTVLPAERVYVCIDLDATSFNGYELARTLKEGTEEVLDESRKVEAVKTNALFIIGAALGIEPAIIQKTKLHRIDALLQRFALEKLLRTLAEGLPLSQ